MRNDGAGPPRYGPYLQSNWTQPTRSRETHWLALRAGRYVMKKGGFPLPLILVGIPKGVGNTIHHTCLDLVLSLSAN